MYLIIGKSDLEQRSVSSKECLIPMNPQDLRVLEPEGVYVMRLGSNRIKRLIKPKEGRVFFPDKPKGWKDSDCVLLACTYSDIKTVGGIVMHKDEAKKVAQYLLQACDNNNNDTNQMVETKGPY